MAGAHNSHYGRPNMQLVGRTVRFDGDEAEGGRCPDCSRGARLCTCSECGFSAWVIDCAHTRPRRFGFSRGRSDGSAAGRLLCDDCARTPPPLAA